MPNRPRPENPAGTDQCEHGIDYDAECAACESEIAEARTAGALTPSEIGIYFKGKAAAAVLRAAAWDEGVKAAFWGAVTRQNADDVKLRNPYRDAASAAGDRGAEA